MSYILDALKKAESERHLGTIPNLHTAQPANIAPPASTRSSGTGPWPWVALAALTIALVALAWLKPWQPAPDAAALPATAALPVQPAAVPVETPPVPASPPSSSVPASSATPPVAAAPAKEAEEKPAKKTPSSAKHPAEKKPEEKKLEEKKLVQAAPSRQQKKEPKPTPDQTQSQERDLGQASEQRAVALHELPAAIQGEIPALSITGYIYSPNKADRTVLINKKLLREGDQIAPDFILEKLTPTGMVLNYKGYRYRTGY
jgi:general secretion pathway protein B